MKSKSVIAAVVAAALLAPSAFAADTAPVAAAMLASNAPLPAGKPAGVKQASFLGPYGVLYVAAGIAIFIGVAASGGFNSAKGTVNTNCGCTSS